MIFRTKSGMLLALAMIALIGFAPHVLAQAIDGNLTGTVVDSSGATVPNATVEATNTRTGIKSSIKTGVDGLFRFNNLSVGTYDINVTASGFAMSGLKNPEHAAELHELNVTLTLSKPFTAEDLLTVVKETISR